MNTTISHLGRFATTLALTAAAGVVWAVPTYADTSAAEAGSCTPTAGNASATVSTRSVQVGSTIKITGAGWCNPAGGGSVIGVKIDEGSISRLDTAVHANKTIWAIVEADSTDGTLDAEIELPDGTAATSAPALETGEHTLRLLSGSLAAGDEMRTVATNAFTVLPADEVVPDAPAWAHEEVRNGGATAWVQSAVTPGGRLKLAGTGWTHPQGGPSTIALKINLTENGEQARRTGSGILQGDATIWALLDASVVDADGNFDTDVDLPPGLTKGQYFTVSLFSGKFASGDTQRTATTSSLTVDGEKWQGGDDNSDVECKPTSDQPTVTIENPSATFGGMLTISGTGWCNPAGGGSKLGVKIDEGGISHLDSSVHANRTIWALVQARHSDGTFTAEIRLPDGTTKTSTPALKPGAHTLRLLSGSLLPGDQVRTLQSEEFVVGAYKPNGIPAPVGKLKKGKRNGLEVTQSGKDVTVKVKGAQKGDWVFLSAYTDDDSPRYPWGEKWFRADARGRIMVTLPKDGAITGKLKLVAQDGNLGRKGRLLGWDDITFPGAEEDPGDDTPKQPTNNPTVSSTPSAPAPTPQQEQALREPPVPVAAKKLRVNNQRAVSATLDGTTLTLEVPAADKGQIGFVTAYVGTSVVPIGGAIFDKQRRLLVDLGNLADTELRLAVQDEDGKLLGWYQHEPTVEPVAEELDGTETVSPATTPTSASPKNSAPVGALDGVLSGIGVALLFAAWGAIALRRRGAVA